MLRFHWVQNAWPWMTLSDHFTLNSAFSPVCLELWSLAFRAWLLWNLQWTWNRKSSRGVLAIAWLSCYYCLRSLRHFGIKTMLPSCCIISVSLYSTHFLNVQKSLDGHKKFLTWQLNGQRQSNAAWHFYVSMNIVGLTAWNFTSKFWALAWKMAKNKCTDLFLPHSVNSEIINITD